jgi:hypothetical protein
VSVVTLAHPEKIAGKWQLFTGVFSFDFERPAFVFTRPSCALDVMVEANVLANVLLVENLVEMTS